MDVVIFFGIYLGVAFLFTLGSVLAVGGVLHAGTRRVDGFLIYLFPVMLLAVVVSTLSSGRNLSLPGALVGFGVEMGAGGAAKWLQRAVTLFLLAVSVERLANMAFGSRKADSPRALMVAFALCWVAVVALPAAFGTRPSFRHEYVYALVIGLAALTTTETGAQRAILFARNALVVFIALGLLLLVIKRDMVLSPYTGSWLPGFEWRFSGLASGPNAMGPLSLLCLLSLVSQPFEKRWLNRFAWGAAMVSLLLTQSKTTWIAAAACFLVLHLVSGSPFLSRWLSTPRYQLAAQVLLALLGLAVVALIYVAGANVFRTQFEALMATQQGTDLVTFTGRDQIWAIAWETFLRSPWFGYGPEIWDAYFRYQIGLPAAFHAHNQVMNVLAASGVVGTLAFSVYCVVLVRRIWPRLGAFNGLPAALGTLLVLRSISEVPFAFDSFGSETMVQMLLLMLVAGAKPRTDRARVPAHGQ
ncbi:O-antigen ligase family protein [Inhella sp.]|uniref:O-antigen ligase family protein n=1 Tax=Inhella sp. TaxID=1921806 RepID=UPI0035AF5E47